MRNRQARLLTDILKSRNGCPGRGSRLRKAGNYKAGKYQEQEKRETAHRDDKS